MRTLIEPSSYHLQNAGDNAMLSACISRIERRFGNATFDVATTASDRLSRIASAAAPATEYVTQRDTLIRRRAQSNSRISNHVASLFHRHLRRRFDPAWPQRQYRLDQTWGEQHANFEPMCHTLRQYDLVVAAGGGYLTDFHPTQALRVLWTLHIAQSCKIPTALFGQGIGPVSSGPLACFAADVLAKAKLIGLREGVHGLGQLTKWSIDPCHIEVTGDDALEFALQPDSRSPGKNVGLNVRVAHYAGVSASQAGSISDLVADFAGRRKVSVEPLLVTTNSGESDQPTLGRLPSIDQSPDDGTGIAALVSAAGRCRVVVTGSYHAAVFALAQGVPAIGIAGSDYYLHKFAGLAGLFGDGCRMLHIQRDGPDTLSHMLESLWAAAPAMSTSLRDAARAQVARGHAFYDRLSDVTCVSAHDQPVCV